MRPAAIIAMVCLTLPSTMSAAAPVQETLGSLAWIRMQRLDSQDWRSNACTMSIPTTSV